MQSRLKNWIGNKAIIIVLFALLAIAASTQALLGGKRAVVEGGIEYNRYNNYTIFKNSYHHLQEGKDLYVLYPEEQWDLYKYTPTFSVVFGVFAIFPDWLGLNLWNLVNALLLVFGVYLLPKFNNYEKGIILLIGLLELLTSMQNEQSNGLMVGLFVMAFAMLERKNYLIATLCIVFSIFIKLFGIVAFALFLFYEKKWKLALFTLMWICVLGALPLLFISIDEYKALIESYQLMLADDHSASYGYSLLGIIQSWFGIEEFNKMIVVGLGALVFMIPFARLKAYKDINFRLLALTSVLLWVIVFNHKSESPTFVIAMIGIGIWFMNGLKSKLDIGLLILALILTSLSTTDLFPGYIRENYISPFYLKALPSVLIWMKVIYEMIVKNQTIRSTEQK